MRVLIAEDDEVLADGLERYLQHAGYATARVASGAHADSLLATEEFELVILDIGLPGLDGFEVLRRLRAANFAPTDLAGRAHHEPHRQCNNL